MGTPLQQADANIQAAIALAVTFIQSVPGQVSAAVAAQKAGDDAGAQSIADDLNTQAAALTAALPTPQDPGTSPAQLAAAKAAVNS